MEDTTSTEQETTEENTSTEETTSTEEETPEETTQAGQATTLNDEETTPERTTIIANESEQTSTDGTTAEEATGSETTEETLPPRGTTAGGVTTTRRDTTTGEETTEEEKMTTTKEATSVEGTTENETVPDEDTTLEGEATTTSVKETTSEEAKEATGTTSEEQSKVVDATLWEPTTEAATTTGTCPCSLPAGTLGHSLITYNDANVSAQNVYSRMTIRGDLADGAPGVWKVADGLVLVGGEAETKWWSFNGGISTGRAFSTVFSWSDFQDLAQRILPGEYSNGYKVVTVLRGGTYTQDNFTESDGQAEDNGHTLVIFNTDEDVVLDRSPSNKALGPSVLAPFSKVTLLNRAGFIDGFLVALELGPQPSSEEGEVDHLQMHGEGYMGPLECLCAAA